MNADRSYRIILADDHALFLSGLQGLLSRRAECEVVGTAANGEKCLALMQESEHDVVLMDIDMPVLDGIRATERASPSIRREDNHPLDARRRRILFPHGRSRREGSS
ncbi:MAG: response regulator transcription factor [Alistipes inops]